SLGRPEIRFGINPLLTKLWLRIGMPKALQISLTGETLSAQEALAIGLVDRVVPAGELLPAARAEAERLARNPLSAVMAVKRAARTVPYMDVRSAIEYEFGLTGGIVAEGSVKQILRDYAKQVGIVRE
ncbi:MAG: enoyl-CoA hydratase-related protein, partial [candidate division NC10 bacterium]